MSHLRRWSWRPSVAALAAVSALAACGAGAEGGSDGASDEVVVFAAASLTEAFGEIGQRFEAANPGATVTFSLAGSNTLATQLVQGAPADVYASANEAEAERVVDEGLAAGEPTTFVTNTLQIVVPEGNPAGVQGLEDFAEEQLTLAVCAAEVPCGDAAQEAFGAAGITPQPDTLAQDVKQVLTKVALGEADAGLVYRTDVASASRPVEGISFPEAQRAVQNYGILRLEDAENPAGAQAFLDYVFGPEGQQVLQSYGFTPTA